MPVGLKEPSYITPIQGVQLSSVQGNLRYTERDDLVLMRIDAGANIASLFTNNKMQAAPVIVARKHAIESSNQQPRLLVVNAGNANAGTGKQGIEDANQCCQQLAQLSAVKPQQVLPFSTGVMGQHFDMVKMQAAIAQAHQHLGQKDAEPNDWIQAANAIKTTDIIAKASSRQIELNGKTISISGFCKGSGMICPNMATMLAFIACDVEIETSLLQSILEEINALSFNRISVDGDTSTNDAVVLIATGKSGVTLSNADIQATHQFKKALLSLMQELAIAIVRDGEGATKLVKINVTDANTEQDAEKVARSIAHSPLVKTALFASDPNWGRILAAIGNAPIDDMQIHQINVHINGTPLLTGGQLDPDYTEQIGQSCFEQSEITIDVALNTGKETYYLWTTDLSHEYIRINAEYRS